MVWSVVNHFEVNIAKDNGKKKYDGSVLYEHWCAVILREDFESVAISKFQEIRDRFPAPEFHCSLVKVECGGSYITVEEDK